MKTVKKTLLLCLCIAAVAAVSVFGTLAYLTDSDSAVNTFTVGKVAITVDEAKVDENGVPVPDAPRVRENTYHLLPGMAYTKDPAMTVLKESELSYVRMILTVHNAGGVQEILTRYQLGDFSVLIGGWDPEIWLYQDFTEDTEANTISFEFRYREAVAGGEEADTVLPALFTTLKVPGQITGGELQSLYDNGFKMEITGHAIQAAGFAEETDDAGNVLTTAEEAAWAAFEAQQIRDAVTE